MLHPDPLSRLTEQAWERFHTPLLQFIRRRVPDEETAEDMLQDVFLKIHQQIETLKDTRKLESWVYQIARHAIIDYYRSKRLTLPLDTPEVNGLSDELPDDDIVSELFPSVRAMVKSLPPQDRQALVLTEYQGLTQKELGERLGISFSGAKSRVQRAREKLKQQLLACCHFELDRRGHILNYQSHCLYCAQGSCCSGECNSRQGMREEYFHECSSPLFSTTSLSGIGNCQEVLVRVSYMVVNGDMEVQIYGV